MALDPVHQCAPGRRGDAWCLAHDSRRRVAGAPSHIDYTGIVTISAGLVALLFALDQVTAWGWGDWRILISLGLSVVLISVFTLVERRAGASALIPADIIRNRGVAFACVLKALMAPAYAASLLYVPRVMQKLFRFSPLETGLGMLPMLGGYAVVSFLVGSLSGRFSVHLGIVAGLAGLAIGPWLISGLDAGTGYTSLLAGMIVLGIGLGLFQPSVTTEAVQADGAGRKSLASGLVLMFQSVGGAIGLGLTRPSSRLQSGPR